jgi:competence protein ComEC
VRTVAAVPAVGLLAGSAFGLFAPDIPKTLACALLIACALGALWAWRVARPAVLAGAVCLAFFTGGALLAADAWREAWQPTLRAAFDELAAAERQRAVAEHRLIPEDAEAFANVSGVLRADAAVTSSGVSLSIDVDRVDAMGGRPMAGGVVATVAGSLGPERADAWRAGRRVRLPVELRRPSRYLDPGVPDHERALARRGTTLVGFVKSGALVETAARGSALDEAMASVRDFSRRSIAAAVGRWSPRSAAIVAAIVIGDRVGLDEDVQRALQEAGTYHVIAISGGNIAILAGLMLGAFRVAGLLGRAAMCSAIVVLVAYGYLVGGGASVDRATLMAVVYFTGRAIDFRSPPLNTLALVAGCLIAAGPLSIADPAFVLTFGATLAILLVMPLVTTIDAGLAGGAGKSSQRFRKSMRPIVAMFAASAAAEAMLFPVGAVVFSRVTFAGLALNFLAIPLMGVAQIAGMVLVPLALVSRPLASGVGYIAHLGALGLVKSAELVRLAPWVTYRVAAPHWVAVCGYYLAAGAAWTLWRRRREITGSAEAPLARAVRRAAGVAAACAAVWILAEPWRLVAAHGDGGLHVTFLDVGQGDSAFVRFPRGATLLVDAGGLSASSAFDIGDRVVAPVLRDAGLRRLSYVALTHGDPDHIGGAAAVLREFRPGEVWEGIPVPRLESLRALRDEAHVLGLKWANVTVGDRIVVDDVEVIVRHPGAADWERQRVRNDDSIVIELRWRDVSVLLPGDIGKEAERVLAATIPPARLRVVKVPHHGSLTSSTRDFVRAIAPRAAVVSVGRGNHFGQPAPDVLDRYRAAGAEIFRTDRDGAVTVDTDGYAIDIHTFTGRRVGLSGVPAHHEGAKTTSAGCSLRLLPFLFQFLDRHVAHRSAGGGNRAFHRGEPAGELLVRLAQRRFGLDAELAREVGHREEEIAHFLLRAVAAVEPVEVIRRVAPNRFTQLVDLFLNLVDDVARARPVEADRRRAPADVVRAQKRGQRGRDAAEQRLRGVRMTGLLGLDLFPPRAHLAG